MKNVHIFDNGSVMVSDTNSSTIVQARILSLSEETVYMETKAQVTDEEFVELADDSLSKKKRDSLLADIINRENNMTESNTTS